MPGSPPGPSTLGRGFFSVRVLLAGKSRAASFDDLVSRGRMKTEGLCFSCVFSSGFERGLKMKLWEDSADSLVLNWTSLKVKYAAIKNTQGGKECG